MKSKIMLVACALVPGWVCSYENVVQAYGHGTIVMSDNGRGGRGGDSLIYMNGRRIILRECEDHVEVVICDVDADVDFNKGRASVQLRAQDLTVHLSGVGSIVRLKVESCTGCFVNEQGLRHCEDCNKSDISRSVKGQVKFDDAQITHDVAKEKLVIHLPFE